MNFTLVQKRHIGERASVRCNRSRLRSKKPNLAGWLKRLRRKMGISHAKFHNRKKNYGGLRPFGIAAVAAVAAIGRGEQQAQAAGSRLELGQ